MRLLYILSIILCLHSCKQNGYKYYITIDVEKEKAKEGYPKSYSVIDSAFFTNDTSAAWEGIKRRWQIIKENKAINYYDGTYNLKLLDENKHDVIQRLTDSFKDRLWSYIPENN